VAFITLEQVLKADRLDEHGSQFGGALGLAIRATGAVCLLPFTIRSALGLGIA
jgi:hypothetical protein